MQSSNQNQLSWLCKNIYFLFTTGSLSPITPLPIFPSLRSFVCTTIHSCNFSSFMQYSQNIGRMSAPNKWLFSSLKSKNNWLLLNGSFFIKIKHKPPISMGVPCAKKGRDRISCQFQCLLSLSLLYFLILASHPHPCQHPG